MNIFDQMLARYEIKKEVRASGIGISKRKYRRIRSEISD